MNERIKELAEQAGLKVNPDGEIGPAFFGSVDAGYRKFAKLIIQECVSVCMDHRVGNQDYNTGRLHCSFDIKDHFGVKE